MQLPIQNIDSVYDKIYLFQRNPKTKKLEITADSNYTPYYYREDSTGMYTTYDGKRASKVVTSIGKDIRLHKGVYETDVPIKKKYIIDKDIAFSPSPLRYMFFDIEVLCPAGTSIKAGTGYISSITIKDSYAEKPVQFYLGDYMGAETEKYEKAEKKLLYEFVKYVKTTQPDMLLAWHIDFDWGYLCKRQPNIAGLLSPVDKDRFWGGKSANKAPMGISVVDYLTLFKKVNMREGSYKLDDICESYLDAGKVNKEVDFDTLSPELKARNYEDVVLLNQLEDKCQLLPYYDEIRRLGRVNWEELYHNSKAIEMLCLLEAKKMNLALPNKNKSNVKCSFQGAMRGIDEPGVFHNIGKYDLSGAYPAAMVNFCLDEMNITDTGGTLIDKTFFKQNPDTLIPRVAKKMVGLKEKIGSLLAKTDEHDPNYSRIKNQYNGIKGIVNSTFGVLGNQYFRLFNEKIVSAITYLIRDLLGYVQEELKKRGYKIIYHDTDSIFIENGENVVDEMNELIQEWGMLKYNKDSVTLNFAYEGHFKDLLILGTCHYYGVKAKEGAKPEVKGIEMKRSSSTKFEAGFQESLIKRVLKGDEKKDVEKWIEKKKLDIKQVSPVEFCVPAKVSLDKVYKNRPIFLRAIDNSKAFDKTFFIKGADKFYYTYINRPKDASGKFKKDSNGKYIDVIAFKDNTDPVILKFKDEIDWIKMIDRNIDKKVDRIFDALKWTETTAPLGLLGCIDSGVSKKDELKKKIDAAF